MKSSLWFIFLMIFNIFQICFSSFLFTSPVLTNSHGAPLRIPLAALGYNLHSNHTFEIFAMGDFEPEHPHIGLYSIEVHMSIYHFSGKSDVRIRNLWNVCDTLYVLSHKIGTSSRGTNYIYHRPTATDPDFSVALELCNASSSAKGFINMYFINDGSSTPPPNFSMLSGQTCDPPSTIYFPIYIPYGQTTSVTASLTSSNSRTNSTTSSSFDPTCSISSSLSGTSDFSPITIIIGLFTIAFYRLIVFQKREK